MGKMTYFNVFSDEFVKILFLSIKRSYVIGNVPSFFNSEYFLIMFILLEVWKNFISNEMSDEKFPPDKNYRFFMVGIDKRISIVFLCFWII